MIKHDNQKLRPNTEDYHFEAEKIHGSEIKEISSQQNKAMRMVMYPILGTKPFGTSEIAVVQRKNFASGMKRGDTHRKRGYPREG